MMFPRFPVPPFPPLEIWSHVFQSCDFHPCALVPCFPVPSFPPLRFGPTFSSLAFSSPAFSVSPLLASTLALLRRVLHAAARTVLDPSSYDHVTLALRRSMRSWSRLATLVVTARTMSFRYELACRSNKAQHLATQHNDLWFFHRRDLYTVT